MSDNKKQFHIVEFYSENVKKLKAVSIKPDGNIIQITGANENGKTSVLDSVWWALTGTRNIQSDPIRQGEEKAEIRLSFGDFIVERKFARKEEGGYTTKLEVYTPEGAKYSSPQDFLNRLLGEISFDPLAFSNMKPADQYQHLKSLSGIGDELEKLEKEEKTAYDDRALANKEVTRAKSALDMAGTAPETRPEPFDASEVLSVMANFDKRREIEKSIEQKAADIEANVRLVSEANDRIDALKREIDAYNAKALELKNEKDAQVQDLANYPTAEDYNAAQEKLKASDSIKASIDQFDRVEQARKTLTERTVEANKADELVQSIRGKIQKLIDGAKMPIDGLELKGGVVYFGGVPFDQCSSAERLRVAVAIAMAANPAIRIVQIRDGSLLDTKNLGLIEELAKEFNFQAWVEKVDESGRVGVVIENGEVKADHYATPPEAAAAIAKSVDATASA